MISTFVQQAQRAAGRSYFIVAFLPTSVVVAVSSVQIWGVEEVRNTIADWSEQRAGRAIFNIFALGVGVFLLAYVLFSMRWSLRAFFEGAWPPFLAKQRQRAVTRMVRKWDDLQRQHALALEKLTAVTWLNSKQLTAPSVKSPSAEALDVSGALETIGAHVCSLKTDEVGSAQVESYIENARAIWLLHYHFGEGRLDDDQVERLGILVDEHRALNSPSAGVRTIGELAEVMVEQERATIDQDLEMKYPRSSADIRPTAFGNVMAQNESYSYSRYGIALRELWPRLEVSADERVIAEVDTSLSRVDFGLSMVIGGASLFLLGVVTSVVRVSVLSFVIGLAALFGSVLAYRFTVLSALAYGRRVAATVDIYRRQTLDALGVDPPLSLDEERRVWARVHGFLARGDKIDFVLRQLQGEGSKRGQSSTVGDQPGSVEGRKGKCP